MIEDKEAFVDLSVDQQSSLIGDDPRLDSRIVELTEAIESMPISRAYSRRGGAYVLKGNYELAMTDFDTAIKLDHGNAHAHYNRGVLHSQLLEHKLAIQDYTSAINADPQYSLAYANRGMDLLELKNYATAIADLREAIKLDPDDHLAMHALGIALFENPSRAGTDIGAARDLLTRACELTHYEYDNYVQSLRYVEGAADVRSDDGG
ncbi:tetratricopeptide repeat protein [Planctomycetes bacterium TBK1r]|uniref:Lipoprotein NlpI n=1 Tax=Stieleria magnilauensis TaxID=2527963 RepID=A0ABX5XZR7_9BACT|nr:lipoprotein NlpI [Planctomycetes bacterium TBK1r]